MSSSLLLSWLGSAGRKGVAKPRVRRRSSSPKAAPKTAPVASPTPQATPRTAPVGKRGDVGEGSAEDPTMRQLRFASPTPAPRLDPTPAADTPINPSTSSDNAAETAASPAVAVHEDAEPSPLRPEPATASMDLQQDPPASPSPTPTPPTPPSPAGNTSSGGKSGEMADYERRRLENIRANEMLMAQLGLAGACAAAGGGAGAVLGSEPPKRAARPRAPPRKRKKPPRAADESTSRIVRRRSSRLSTQPKPAVLEDAALGRYEAEPEPEELFEAPPAIGTAFESVSPRTARTVHAGSEHLQDSTKTVQLTGHRHNVYAMAESRSGCLVAAGKGGLISFFQPCGELAAGPDACVLATLSAKAHKRWVSEVETLADGDDGDGFRVVSAADDQQLIVSQYTPESNGGGQPASLVPTARASLHAKGIFGMAVQRDQALTCSKDGTVALTSVSPATLSPVRTWDASDDVLKSVRWRPGTPTFACCGNDRSVYLFDSREPSATHAIHGAHGRAINSLAFNPDSPDTFLTAGADDCIRLWDLRFAQTAVLTGFNAPGRAKAALTTPHFYRGDVVTIGVNTPNVYVFSPATGVLQRKVYVGFTPGCLFVHRDGTKLTAAQASQSMWSFPAGV